MTGAGPAADFGLHGPEPIGVVRDRWRALRRHVGPGFHTAVVATQVHGASLAIHQTAPTGWCVIDDVDGHLTTKTGVLLTVTLADCVPVYLACPERGALALLHAGWRGLAAGIVETGLRQLCEIAGATADAIVTHCGVSICRTCYEVGPEVWEQVRGTRPEGARHLDLRAEIGSRLRTAGVGAVSLSGWCTAHDTPRFFSHRASRGQAGRMVAYLGRPDRSPVPAA